MRILFLSPRLPFPPIDGGRIRVLELIRGLSANHNVSLLTVVTNESELEQSRALEPYCTVHTARLPLVRRSFGAHVSGMFSPVPHYRIAIQAPEFERKFAELTQHNSFDIIQAEYLGIAHYAASVRGPTKVLDMHNIELVYLRRLLGRAPLKFCNPFLLSDLMKLPHYHKHMTSSFDRVLTVSEDDAQTLRRLVPGAQISVIPNGVDLEAFHPEDHEDTGRLVFVGNLLYPPNVDAMLLFCRKILPCIRMIAPEARVTIVGQEPPPGIVALQALAGVEVTGRVADVRPYLGRASVVVVPLRFGSGTRLKVLEAMAMAKAVVSTRVGVEGLDVRAGYDVEIADAPHAFAQAVATLLHDPRRRRELGANALRTVRHRYGWSQIVARLDAVLTADVQSAGAATPADGRAPLGVERAGA